MTKAKQRDTADQTVAELKQCLKTWDWMRGKDKNVRNSISRCMTTQCSFHRVGSPRAALYATASKNTTNFLTYLLCTKINRNELAVTVDERVTLDGDSISYERKKENQMRLNLIAASERKLHHDENFAASCAKKGEQKKRNLTLHITHSNCNFIFI
jgi:hypothetical protein